MLHKCRVAEVAEVLIYNVQVSGLYPKHEATHSKSLTLTGKLNGPLTYI